MEVYHRLVRQADMRQQSLVETQSLQLVADSCHICQKVTHRDMAEDAQQDLIGQIRQSYRGTRPHIFILKMLG